MYLSANMKNWFHHMHFPRHESIVHVEEFFLSRWLWGNLALVILLLALVAMILWAAHLSLTTEATIPFSEYIPIP